MVVMAMTTTFADPAPKDCIELPWNPDSRPVSTGLARRSAAVVTWLASVYSDEVTDTIGTVPTSIMKQIHEQLTRT